MKNTSMPLGIIIGMILLFAGINYHPAKLEPQSIGLQTIATSTPAVDKDQQEIQDYKTKYAHIFDGWAVKNPDEVKMYGFASWSSYYWRVLQSPDKNYQILFCTNEDSCASGIQDAGKKQFLSALSDNQTEAIKQLVLKRYNDVILAEAQKQKAEAQKNFEELIK